MQFEFYLNNQIITLTNYLGLASTSEQINPVIDFFTDGGSDVLVDFAGVVFIPIFGDILIGSVEQAVFEVG